MMAIRELKVCLLGDTGVGKSSIVCRFVQDHFDHNISPTIGASFMTKTVPCGNELHKFLIWDTAGQERFHSLAPMYYRGSAAAVIVYDITKQDSFHTLKKWVKELKEHGPENIVMAIAGNKCDLSDIREVPMKDAKEYAESIGAIVVETSAKNAVNIEELFQGISQQIPPLDPHENGNNGAIKLGRQTSQTEESATLPQWVRRTPSLTRSKTSPEGCWKDDSSVQKLFGLKGWNLIKQHRVFPYKCRSLLLRNSFFSNVGCNTEGLLHDAFEAYLQHSVEK
uniref:RAB31, member RAS onco family n=1 Tax=Coturnix japonica TaxID=93934 RepID=A0A8C2T8W4_COTJA